MQHGLRILHTPRDDLRQEGDDPVWSPEREVTVPSCRCQESEEGQVRVVLSRSTIVQGVLDVVSLTGRS